MAFTDFELLGTQATVLHSAAPLTTNPLSSSLAGTYCRTLQYSGSFPPKMYFTTSSYGGGFYNIPNTKVISARAHLRYTTTATSNLITVKDTTTFNSTTVIKGYSFGMCPVNDTNRGAAILFGNDNSILISKSIGYSQFFQVNTWYSLRMDVFPLGAAGDRIICYMEVDSPGGTISTPGSGIWNSTLGGVLFDITVATANPAYAPWSSNARNGISSRQPFGTSDTGYVDNINFTTYNAP